MQNWDVAAPEYHMEWAQPGRGPFRSTAELVGSAEVRPGDRVLDIGCGTGAVSAEAMKRLGPTGSLTGIDLSFGALRIAKASVPKADFAQMDAERIGIHGRFDKILCQYALMFFPDAIGVLRSIRGHLSTAGRAAFAVHGEAEGVPYFSTIMEPVLEAIPGIRPAGAPTVHRFGDPKVLRGALEAAGFSSIKITKWTFYYSSPSFETYWSDYLSTTARSIRAQIEADPVRLEGIRQKAERRALVFLEGGRIRFPWDVLIATAGP